MYASFYTATSGMLAQQRKLDVTANNLANVNNYGYKSQNACFADLIQFNLNNKYGQETTMKAGVGVKVEHTNTNFSPNAFVETDGAFDYAIDGKGFFRLVNPTNGEVTYTRNGRFSMSQRGNLFYLINDAGNRVTDQNGNQIIVRDGELSAEPGVYNFNITDGMLSVGDNEFVPVAKNGNPFVVRGAKVISHALEMSGTNVADEITKVIESQRAYSYAMRMAMTSDEIVNTVNSLRQ